MKKSLVIKLLILLLLVTNISGCIVLPGWYGYGGRGHYHGEYWEGGHGWYGHHH